MQLREALSQIAEIRQQIARTEVFRGYRALPIALSGILAMAAAVLQARWIPNPTENIAGYLTLWLTTAVVSAAAASAEMAVRYYHAGSALTREITWLAVEQFLPCLVAGCLVTVTLLLAAPQHLLLLPGLWPIFFSLGIFASWRLLPRAIFWVGLFYLLAGGFNLLWARGEFAFSPWAMGASFGVGQCFAAAVLYWTLERQS